MKKSRIQMRLGIALAGLLLGSAGMTFGQLINVTNDYTALTFDNSNSALPAWNWWGMLSPSWDSAQDHTGNGGGALYMSGTYGAAGGNNTTTFMVPCSLNTNATAGWDNSVYLNGYNFTNLQFWMKYDTNSSCTISNLNSGNHTGFRVYLTDQSWNTTQLGAANWPEVLTNGDWLVFNYPITGGSIAAVPAVSWGDWDDGIYTENKTVALWVDDVVFNFGSIPPPPTIQPITAATPGLNIFSYNGGSNDRQNLATVNQPNLPVLSFVNNGDVSYSFTLRSFPTSTNAAGFAVREYLVGSGIGTIGAPDWNNTNCIFLELQINGITNVPEGNTNTVYLPQWIFRWKTNAPSSNGPTNDPYLGGGGYYSSNGIPAVLTESSIANILGTWTVSFHNNTSVTMTSPTGMSTNFTLADPYGGGDITPVFADPFQWYIGTMNNGHTETDLSAVISQVKFTGSGISEYTENFGTQLDTNYWSRSAASSFALQVVPTNGLWLKWTVPDGGFTLETNSVISGNVNPNGWNRTNLPAPVAQMNEYRWTLLTTNTAFTTNNVQYPAKTGSLYFRLANP
jgi:hypothetical protein